MRQHIENFFQSVKKLVSKESNRFKVVSLEHLYLAGWEYENADGELENI